MQPCRLLVLAQDSCHKPPSYRTAPFSPAEMLSSSHRKQPPVLFHKGKGGDWGIRALQNRCTEGYSPWQQSIEDTGLQRTSGHSCETLCWWPWTYLPGRAPEHREPSSNPQPQQPICSLTSTLSPTHRPLCFVSST